MSKVPESFSLLNTFPAHSQTHCLSKGRTLVTATPREPAGLGTGALESGLGRRGGERGEEWREGWGGKGERGASKEREMWVRRKSEEEGKSECGACVWEREKDHGGVRGRGVCSSTSGLSM